MTMHPTTALLIADERRRDLERTAAARRALPRRPRRLRLARRRTDPAPLTQTT